MTEILRSADCGNSPKNKFAQEISIALAAGDVEFLAESVAVDVTWRIVGQSEVNGLPGLTATVAGLTAPRMITIKHVMTHGKVGAVNGTVRFANGRIREFCDVIEFTGAKGTQVRSIVSYAIMA